MAVDWRARASAGRRLGLRAAWRPRHLAGHARHRRWTSAATLLLAAWLWPVTLPAQPAPTLLAACGECHGPAGNAQIAHYPSLAGQPRLFIENQLVLIREGLRDVPLMKDVMTGMSDAVIVELARHYAQQPVRPRPGPLDTERFRLGQSTSAKMRCGSCHLPDYAGQQQVPSLAGQNEDYLLQAMKDFRDRPGPGRDTIMSASLYGLLDSDLANLAHYLALSPVRR